MSEPIFRINHDSPVRKIDQLVEEVQAYIKAENLAKGYKLPSVNYIRKSSMLSRDTVVKAYNKLIKQGYVFSIPNKGYYVKHAIHQSAQNDSQKVATFMKRLYDRGLTTPSGGNISLRSNDNQIFITPSGLDKANLEAEDIIRIKDGRVKKGDNPSSELPFHLQIYKEFDEVAAVVHAHSPACIAFSMSKEPIDTSYIPSYFDCFMGIGIAKYAITGSSELGDEICKVIREDKDVVFLENHGVLTIGKSMEEAFAKFEAIEQLAESILTANLLGTLRNISNKDMAHSYQQALRYLNTFEIVDQQPEKQYSSLLEILKRAYNRKLLLPLNGAISERDSQTSFVINPERFDPYDINTHALVKVHDSMIEGKSLPSRYMDIHHEIYKQHPEINAIATINPASVMAFAITGENLYTQTLAESYVLLKEVHKYPYALRFNEPYSLGFLINDDSPAFILENDCLVVTAKDLVELIDLIEVTVNTAKTILYSKQLQQVEYLSKEQILELDEKFFNTES